MGVGAIGRGAWERGQPWHLSRTAVRSECQIRQRATRHEPGTRDPRSLPFRPSPSPSRVSEGQHRRWAAEGATATANGQAKQGGTLPETAGDFATSKWGKAAVTPTELWTAAASSSG